ncbi:thiamine-phosphate kinase [Sphingomonas laterariae]|uniref:Thiamine-monophosphate kinase n=1 Tax=Edaphosphingomonas laterariae TaxID=861865 RepID=A0A239G6Z3_9SPHN|nr:thiamine-phosphate kinase [Sphingomonas laterariae]SNS65106.1 thiamine-phosphate kinase [Sphingomonas laterariae]
MTRESDFIAALRAIATHPAARGLADDAAVLPLSGDIVLTHDMLVEGVHFLPGDTAQDVAWKLVAVNLSDLAAKGAVPVGLLMGYGFAGGPGWDADFAAGLDHAVRAFAVPLLGGDTVAMPAGAPRTLGLTAIGQAPAGGAPSRAGARAGDDLWATGTIGDAGLGLAIALGDRTGPAALLRRYHRPQPRLAFGQAIATSVAAMADISDGLLIDAGRMATASGLAIAVDLAAIPLSDDLLSIQPDNRPTRIAAATAGDDYELLFAAPPSAEAAIRAIAAEHGLPVARVGAFTAGTGIALRDGATAVALPGRLGFEHGPVA